MRTSTTMSAAALLAALILTSSCSTEQPGTATPAQSTTTPTSTPATPLTNTTPAAAPSTRPPETLILGTNRLGTHQFNLETGYNAQQIAQGVELVLTGRTSSGYGYPQSATTNTRCPTSQAVTAATSFECTVDINGETKTVTVDIISNWGAYIVQAPQ